MLFDGLPIAMSMGKINNKMGRLNKNEGQLGILIMISFKEGKNISAGKNVLE